MKDFATKLPRIHAAALAADAAKGDVTEPYRALLDVAIEDIPKLGWDAPTDLLRLVQRVIASRGATVSGLMSFDIHGAGPFCAHGAIPIFCSTCDYDAGDLLRSALVALAKESA